jgi:hypothetical protein
MAGEEAMAVPVAGPIYEPAFICGFVFPSGTLPSLLVLPLLVPPLLVLPFLILSLLVLSLFLC